MIWSNSIRETAALMTIADMATYISRQKIREASSRVSSSFVTLGRYQKIPRKAMSVRKIHPEAMMPKICDCAPYMVATNERGRLPKVG